MKKFSFLVLAAAGMLLGACSSDKDEVAQTPFADGDSYIAFGVNLPSVPVTRANDNADGVELDDGLNSEYAVKDAILIVFSKPTDHDIEGDQSATFKAAYTIFDETTPWNKNSDEQVTEVSRRVVQKVDASKVEVGSLMLVVLNTNGKLGVTSGDGLTVNGTAFAGTFAELQALIYNTTDAKSCMWNNGFFMSNATLSSLQGSTTTAIAYAKEAYQNLVAVNQIYESEQAAQNASTVPQIYVARGMAKVTLSASTTGTVREMDADVKVGGKKLITTVEGWVLDNTNKKSYIVPSLAGISDFTPLHSNITGGVYRFTGNTAITTGSPSFPYRTYFAKDPNYTGSLTLADEFNILTTGTDLDWTNASKKYVTTFGAENPQYCFENTFDVDGQVEQKTTVARLAVSVKQEGETTPVDLFVVNGNKSAPVLEVDAETIFKNAVLKYIEDNGKSTYVATTLLASDITVGLSTAAGKVTFTAATSTATPKLTTAGQDLLTDGTMANTAMINALNNGTDYVNVIRYKNGISYYTVRIKHFGADGSQTNNKLCPWKEGETVGGNQPSSTNGVYPAGAERDGNYLGRYGVLRNNWYDISIGKISGLGDATPQELSTVTDDEIDSYIAFQINVLSWAKRAQTWSF